MARPHARSRSDADDGAGGELFDDVFLKKLEYLYVVSKKAFTGRLRAERRTRKIGSGIEFADHRDYAPGDDFRYIDWNIYGRMDRLLLRLFEEEEDLSIYLLLDHSKSMTIGTPTKLAYAKQVVAALAYVGLANLDRVSIVPVAERVGERLPPERGKGRIFKVFDFLRGLAPEGATKLGPAVQEFVRMTKRRGIVVLVSDFYDPAGFEEGVNVLRYNRFEPIVVQLVDPREESPPLYGDLTLVDCETGDLREVTISAKLLEEYKREHAKFCAALEDHCTTKAIPYFKTRTDVPFDELILRVFRTGGFLR